MTNPGSTEGREGQQHTPGPWRKFETPQKIEILCNDRLAPACMPSTGIKIAEVRFKRIARGGTFAGNDVDEANARLIAAAPELLAALNHLATAVRDTENQWGKVINIAVHASAIAAFAAIAKAEGR